MKTAGTIGAEIFQRSGATGMVLIVVRNKQVFFQGYGETAPHSHQLPGSDAEVRLCSLTKIFTTDLLTKLVNDKAVSLNDPLQKFAPAKFKVPGNNGEITLEDLATHTAGLPREIGYPQDGAAFTFPDYATRWEWLPQQHPRWQPGSAAHYSNIGYDLLSDGLSSAAHKPFATLLSERTLQPLKMYQTTYYPNPEQCSRLMVAARYGSPCTVTEATAGSSGLYSTPKDMAQWLEYLLNSQPAAAQAIYLRPDQVKHQQGMNHAGEPSGLGLGWVHLNDPNDPSHLVQKTGGGAGFLSYIVIHPASHTALFLAATEGPRTAHSYNLFKNANNLILQLAGLPPMPEDEKEAESGHLPARNARHALERGSARPTTAAKTHKTAGKTARSHTPIAPKPAAKSAPKAMHQKAPAHTEKIHPAAKHKHPDRKGK